MRLGVSDGGHGLLSAPGRNQRRDAFDDDQRRRDRLQKRGRRSRDDDHNVCLPGDRRDHTVGDSDDRSVPLTRRSNRLNHDPGIRLDRQRHQDIARANIAQAIKPDRASAIHQHSFLADHRKKIGAKVHRRKTRAHTHCE